MSERPTLVYGYLDHFESLAILPEQVAQEMAEEVQAIARAQTWGELKSVPIMHNPALHPWPADVETDETPADDAPFDLEEHPLRADGDWPMMAPQYVLEHAVLPGDVLRELGTVESTVFNGNYLSIPSSGERAMLEVLERNGYDCRRDDELIVRCQYINEDLESTLKQIAEGTYAGA
ncbi:MAG: hypothetical protein ACTHYM_03835 [Actinomycetaceae bacterium]